MTNQQHRAMMVATCVIVSAACWWAWVTYRNYEIHKMIDERMSDRFRKAEMRAWAEELQEKNHNITVPKVK